MSGKRWIFLWLPLSLLAGFIIGLSGFCGDVVMSAIKRDKIGRAHV